VTGTLRCVGCAAEFPIIRGVPRLVEGNLPEEERRTAAAFGWEWQEFHDLHGLERYREQFLDWIHPLQPSFFEDKVVLDAGCGMGRFAIVSALFGARDVLAVDVSDAVEAAAENARPYPNVHVVQGDIHRLPLRKGPAGVVDFAYAIGVLHHLPEPSRGFFSICGHVRDGGSMFAWVYGRENNGWIVHLVNPIRESISSRLPRRAVYAISWIIAAAIHVPLKVLYQPSGLGRLGFVQKRLPYRAYLGWLAQYSLHHNHHVVFDHLVAPTSHYIHRDEFASWFDRAGLVDAQLSWRNENSWRGFGRLERERREA
jgi:SAM-dependent methyltransferase